VEIANPEGRVTTGTGILLDHLRRTLAAPALAGLSDGQLLRLFAVGGGAAGPAFEALLRRHGPMVLRACRAALRDPHAAEDCFQATFLVLVRKAGALRRPDALGPWLFGVVRRISARARAAAARRETFEPRAAVPEAVLAGGPEPDVVVLVHDAVGRLPESLRAAVVLCDLEGLTYQDAAERLGWTPATLRGRLARARRRLRDRLARLGLGPDAALALAPVVVPRALVTATARAAAVAAGQSAGAVAESVLWLMNGGLQSMFLTKLKATGLSLLTAGVLVAGAIGLSAQGPAQKSPPAKAAGGGPAGGDVYFEIRLDRAEYIAELARRAKRRQAEGNTEGAVQALRQIEEATRQWQERLRQERAGTASQQKELLEQYLGVLNRDVARQRDAAIDALKGQVDALARERDQLAQQLHDLGVLPRDHLIRVDQPRAEPQQHAPADARRPAGNPPKPAPDLESRLSEVERKLDRILQALDGHRPPDHRPESPAGK
jgi:RNA polymerase sigma factor (sigma-70 family)